MYIYNIPSFLISLTLSLLIHPSSSCFCLCHSPISQASSNLPVCCCVSLLCSFVSVYLEEVTKNNHRDTHSLFLSIIPYREEEPPLL
jgi:hypothetical protein